MHYGHHRVLHHRRERRASARKRTALANLIDDAAYFMGITAVLVNVPQLLTVWVDRDISGVSVVSWVGFLLGSVFWLGYGLFHREKPLIVINTMLIIVQGAIVVGILAH